MKKTNLPILVKYYLKFLTIQWMLWLVGCACATTTENNLETELNTIRGETTLYLNASHIINDLKNLPQDATAYLDSTCANQPLLSPQDQKKFDHELNQKFFAPWQPHKNPSSKIALQWHFKIYRDNLGYGENQQPHSIAWINELIELADLSHYPNTQRPAITLRNTHLRGLPTDKPHFNDSSIAGEGYPFDNLQHSVIWANTPIFVSHLSVDKSWAFTESSVASGWINMQDIAFMSMDAIKEWRRYPLIALIKDDVSLLDDSGIFRFKGQIGAIFPKVGENSKNYRILIAIGNENHEAIIKQATLSKEVAVAKPLSLSPATIAPLINQLMLQPYGWGGLHGNRDCSSTLKDLFTPFGLWLPRNSAHQAKTGHFISLAHLNAQEKEKQILADGIPYKTLLWKEGHILLYIGSFRGKALVFHNLWGVKTWENGKEGRKVIGRAVITTLEPGSELTEVRDEDNILKNIIGMTMLAPTNLSFNHCR